MRRDWVDADHPAASGWGITRWIAGLILLVAAGLKIRDLVMGAVSPASPFASPSTLMAVADLEILLGLWLILGIAPAIAWRAAVVFFAGMALVSLNLAWIGRSSCGCLGSRLAIHPWYTFFADLALVIALSRWRPGGEASRHRLLPSLQRTILTGCMWFLGGAVLLALGYLAIHRRGSSVNETLASWRGESLDVQPSFTDLGRLVPGTSQTFRVRLVNHTDHPIHIFGGTSDCSCMAADDLPADVSAHGSRTLDVVVKIGGTTGSFSRSFIFYTDDRNQPEALAGVTGRVVPTDDRPGS
ncbi:MAG TPA: DUF1573 domain-containing protein [Isosphaeraceae bacterium]|nr:DUF1573 domain-containing protein [Isosphaeraceae bacterium]